MRTMHKQAFTQATAKFINAIMIVMLVLVALPVTPAYALTCTSVATGFWSAAGTWSGCSGGIPGSGDAVIIAISTTVTLDGNYTIASLTFTGGATAAVLTHSSNYALTVNGTVIINQITNTGTTAWNINEGSATVSGLITFQGIQNNSGRLTKIVITSGTLNANGGITFTGNGNYRIIQYLRQLCRNGRF